MDYMYILTMCFFSSVQHRRSLENSHANILCPLESSNNNTNALQTPLHTDPIKQNYNTPTLNSIQSCTCKIKTMMGVTQKNTLTQQDFDEEKL